MSDTDLTAEIIVGVDDSPASEPALQWAAAEAVLRQCRLVIVYAVNPIPVAWSAVPAPAGLVDWQQAIGREILADAEKIARNATDGAVEISTEFFVAAPIATLVERSARAQMVVVGSRGRGALSRTVLGSVSTGLVHRAQCPVAVIHDEEDAAPPAPTAPVLLGFDGSEAGQAATALAFEEASRRGVELIALHAWWSSGAYDFPGAVWEEVQPDVEREVAEQLARWQERFPGVAVQRIVVPDLPAQRLVNHSSSAQLLIVGSRGHGAVASALLGSVSTAVVQAARIPVIVARPR
ncbi:MULTISPECIES: universal stress protein [Mycobacteriaceae]|uniref:universal stress protein n=1 Tax=Mycobacteriaceae TaxID=1762 RepID=UPI0007FFE98A|nr:MULTISPECIES: universal stress protein [Mycobacteriaceae]MCK0175474.1 universal stress protein [Mycolicibacterium sp. F2034L]OBB59972.1 universal stress protein [Mycobacterium sp. 852013-51886_SCH5428379]